MSVEHTPGPWINDAPGCVAKHWPEGGKATVCICPAGAEGEANARLIAAAPETAAERDQLRALNADMLAALREYDAYMSRFYRDTDDGPMSEQNRASWKAARAAIARAEGARPMTDTTPQWVEFCASTCGNPAIATVLRALLAERDAGRASNADLLAALRGLTGALENMHARGQTVTARVSIVHAAARAAIARAEGREP